MIESLESRRLLSVTLEDGVLTVTGTAESDRLAVGRRMNTIFVYDNGTRSMWNAVDVQSILINGLGGNDYIAVVSALMRPLTANGGEGDDAMLGGPGSEQLNGDAGNDKIFGGGGGDMLDGGDDNDIIVGGRGQDHMMGGNGNDRFDAFDREQDFVDGGEGEDSARVDQLDMVQNVEHVFIGPRPPPPSSIQESLSPSGTRADPPEQVA